MIIICVIAHYPVGVKAKQKDLENCFDSNPHGAGFMYQHRRDRNVIIKKGFMTFDDFWKEFSIIPDNVDRVAHFRIATSGKVDKGCCHPFPLIEDYKEMRKPENKSKFAVAHNGIIHWTEPKDKLQAIYSDSMAFIANYLNKCRPLLFEPSFGDIVNEATGSKFAIMSANKVMLIGEFEQHNGAFFSNDSYQPLLYFLYDYKKDVAGALTGGDGVLDFARQGFFRIAFFVKSASWTTGEFLCKLLEKQGAFVDDYWPAKGSIIFELDTLPKYATFCGFEWKRLQGQFFETGEKDEEVDEEDCDGVYGPACDRMECKFVDLCKERCAKEKGECLGAYKPECKGLKCPLEAKCKEIVGEGEERYAG